MNAMRTLRWLPLLLLAAALPAPAATITRGFFPPERVDDSSWVKKMATGDFDGDGRLDFATIAWEIDGRCEIAGVRYEKGYLVRVYLNTTAPGMLQPTFAPAIELPYVDGAYRLYDLWTSDLAAADVNLDGKDDLLVANTHSDQVYTYLSTGAGFTPAIPSQAEHDPTYIAVADLDADTRPDVALLHLERNVRGNDYHWKFSFLLGDGAGHFGSPAVQDLGNAEFPHDHGPHYNTQTFQLAGAPGGKRLTPATLRDAVYMNAGLKWLRGGAVVSEGKEPRTAFANPWGFALFRRPGVRIPALAEAGGRLLLGERERLGDFVLAEDDSSLIPRFLNLDGSPGRLDHFGQAVALHDFDADGLDDLAMLSNEKLDDLPKNDSRAIFVAYGDSGSPHPLSITASATPFVERFKVLDNLSGLWALGDKAGTLLAGDFNGDGYPDLLTVAGEGIQVHVNFGEFAVEAIEPEIHQHKGIIPAGNFAGQRIDLWGAFVTRRFKVNSVFFTPLGAPQEKIDLPGRFDTTLGSFWFTIPPDNVVKPGDYTLSVYNGTAESKRFNPPLKIKFRPLEQTGLKVGAPPAGSPTFPVTIYGWFGNDPADQKRNSVKAIDSRQPTVEIAVASRYPDLSTLVVDVPVAGRVQYQIVVKNPDRGGFSTVFTVDHTPKIDSIRWVNPDRTAGHIKHVNPIPMQPGAQVWIEGSMLLAPGTDEWRLLKGATEVKSGSGAIQTVLIQHDNDRATLLLTLPSDLKEDSGLSFQLRTSVGLLTNALGSLAVKNGMSPPEGKPYWYAAEAKSGLHCATESFRARDDAAAEMSMKSTYPDAMWVVTKLKDQAEHDSRPCEWGWKYQILDSGGHDLGERTVETATRGIADVKIQTSVPPGGSANFKEGPIKP